MSPPQQFAHLKEFWALTWEHQVQSRCLRFSPKAARWHIPLEPLSFLFRQTLVADWPQCSPPVTVCPVPFRSAKLPGSPFWDGQHERQQSIYQHVPNSTHIIPSECGLQAPSIPPSAQLFLIISEHLGNSWLALSDSQTSQNFTFVESWYARRGILEDRIFCQVAANMRSGARLPKLKLQPYHLLAVWPWANGWTSLCLFCCL